MILDPIFLLIQFAYVSNYKKTNGCMNENLPEFDFRKILPMDLIEIFCTGSYYRQEKIHTGSLRTHIGNLLVSGAFFPPCLSILSCTRMAEPKSSGSLLSKVRGAGLPLLLYFLYIPIFPIFLYLSSILAKLSYIFYNFTL